jgi:hypothetical protein
MPQPVIGFSDYRTVSLVVERHLDTVEVRGSSPLRCTPPNLNPLPSQGGSGNTAPT